MYIILYVPTYGQKSKSGKPDKCLGGTSYFDLFPRKPSRDQLHLAIWANSDTNNNENSSLCIRIRDWDRT